MRTNDMYRACWLSVVVSMVVQAHRVGVSSSEWAQGLHPSLLQGRFSFTAAEVSSAQEARRLVLQEVSVSRGAVCAVSHGEARAESNQGIEVRVAWTCPQSTQPVQVNLQGLLARLSPAHRHLSGDQVAYALKPIFEVAPVRQLSVSTLIPLGMEHILTGVDHILFVVALLLGLRGLRATLATVTAFTVGHSMSLGLTSLFQYSPPARLVEPLIALSIVYVAFQNLRQRMSAQSASHPWVVALFFGVVHGFGFAGALKEIAIAPNELVSALLGFNVGVELGQLLVLSVPLLVLWRLRTQPQFAHRLALTGSALILVPGTWWFVTRLFEVSS